MHQIDRGVRLEQIAPRPLTGIRLAGNQKHAQFVAHTIDVDDGAVVDRRKLSGERRGLDFDDVRAAVRDGDVDALRRADRHSPRFHDVAVTAHRYRRGSLLGALILDLVGDGLRLANDAEARRGDQRDAAIALVLVTGDERMNGCGKAERAGVRGHIVHAAVGDHDGAGDAIGGHVGERRPERGEQSCAVGLAVRLPGLDHAHVEPGDTAQPPDNGGARFFGLPRAVAKILARAFVDHHDGDRAEGVAILARQRRVGERQRDERKPQRADRRAAAARYEEQHGKDGDRRQRGPENLDAHERGEGDAKVQFVLLLPKITGLIARAAPARALGRPCSCR